MIDYQEHDVNHTNSGTITAMPTDLSNKKNTFARKTSSSKLSNVTCDKTSDVVSNQSIINSNKNNINLSLGDEIVRNANVNRLNIDACNLNKINNNTIIRETTMQTNNNDKNMQLNSTDAGSGKLATSNLADNRTTATSMNAVNNNDDYKNSQKSAQNSSKPSEILSWREPNAVNKLNTKSSNNYLATNYHQQSQPSAVGNIKNDIIKTIDNNNQSNNTNNNNSNNRQGSNNYGTKQMPLSNRESNKYTPKATIDTDNDHLNSDLASASGGKAITTPYYVETRLPIAIQHNHEDIVHFVGLGMLLNFYMRFSTFSFRND